MKNRKFITLACGALLLGGVLTACSSNQANSNQVQSVDETKTVGFMKLANENKERIWFRVSDSNEDGEISKDDSIGNIYIIKNGKADTFHIADLTLADIRDMGDKEIISLAKSSDEEFFNQDKNKITDGTKTAIKTSESEIQKYETYTADAQDEAQFGIQMERENIAKSNQILAQIEEVNYKEAQKFYSNYTLNAVVETDSSGNNVSSEEITFMTYDLTIEFSNADELIKFQANERSVKLVHPIMGEIYEQNYKGYYLGASFLVTTSLEESVNLGLDKLNTKNVTEE